MHGHGNENGTTPFIGDGEAAPENKERDERRQMQMHERKKQGVQGKGEEPAKITFENAVEKETKNKFLKNGCNDNGEENNQCSFSDGFRSGKKIDDLLSTRFHTFAENALC